MVVLVAVIVFVIVSVVMVMIVVMVMPVAMIMIMVMVVVVVVVMVVVMLVVVAMVMSGRMHEHIKPGPRDPLPVGFFDQKIELIIQTKLGQAFTDCFRARADIEQSAHEHIAADA